MVKAMVKEIKRISVALDDKTDELLNDLITRKNMTVSDIVRLAIITYSTLESEDGEVDIARLKKYAKLLYGGENVIVDIELWTCLLDEVTQRGSEELWNCIEEIGEMYGSQFKNMGLNVKDTLKYLEEATNWFRLKANGGNSCTLILRAKNEANLLKVILKSMFDAQGTNVEITNGSRKITIKETN